MMETLVEHELTLWFEDDVPARMVFAGTRWLVSDMPTRLRESVWSAALGKRGSGGAGLYGWRFQATNPAGESYVFDVFGGSGGWHVHHCYE
ncbi:hypothetical protein [uncultured Microbacterium sp.]|uniref:hypothetical protein n=1 Tax=uncultured Microbacterium sp. TaxID=191216 RepID=UPI00260F9ECF|nr:hypothetical protein [uncultured Microbacterium sp.]